MHVTEGRVPEGCVTEGRVPEGCVMLTFAVPSQSYEPVVPAHGTLEDNGPQLETVEGLDLKEIHRDQNE